MTRTIRCTLPLIFGLAALAAHGQDYFKTHGGSLSVGGFGQFTTVLTANPTAGTYSVPKAGGGGTVTAFVSGQREYTTDSAGFVTSLQFHPKPWAGVEFNYGFTHYQERYSVLYGSSSSFTSTSGSPSFTHVVTDVHEATGAYQFHPKHIPFQPFVNIGGGALDYAPTTGSNQWRGAGLLEAGFDVPTHMSHIGFRIEGRSLYSRAPNFYNPAISTRSWRVTEEPSISTYYRF
jgi:hypothetical protein